MSISKILKQFTGPCFVTAAESSLPQAGPAISSGAGFERGGCEL